MSKGGMMSKWEQEQTEKWLDEAHEKMPCGHHVSHEQSVSGIQFDGQPASAEWCEVCEQIEHLSAALEKIALTVRNTKDRVSSRAISNEGIYVALVEVGSIATEALEEEE
jgi:hypothetical protein